MTGFAPTCSSLRFNPANILFLSVGDFPEGRWRSRSNFCIRSSVSDDRRALFSRIAPTYDHLNDMLTLGQHRIWKRMAVSWSGVKMGDTVLDLCCGSGDLSFLLSEKVGFNGKVIAVDFSKEQLSIAASKQQSSYKACFRNIEWVEGDATDLQFAPSSFDAITVGYGLRNVVDRNRMMKEILRVLKVGAKVSILDFNKSPQQKISSFQEWMIDNVVVPVAAGNGLAEDYEYLKNSIREYLTGCCAMYARKRRSLRDVRCMFWCVLVGKELEQLAARTGFTYAKHYEIGGGLMGNLVATR